MEMGAVWWYTRSSPQYFSNMLRSRYQLWTLCCRLRITSCAAGLNVTGASPGGQLRHFWVPL